MNQRHPTTHAQTKSAQVNGYNRPKPIIDPSRITPTELTGFKTIVRGSQTNANNTANTVQSSTNTNSHNIHSQAQNSHQMSSHFNGHVITHANTNLEYNRPTINAVVSSNNLRNTPSNSNLNNHQQIIQQMMNLNQQQHNQYMGQMTIQQTSNNSSQNQMSPNFPDPPTNLASPKTPNSTDSNGYSANNTNTNTSQRHNQLNSILPLLESTNMGGLANHNPHHNHHHHQNSHIQQQNKFQAPTEATNGHNGRHSNNTGGGLISPNRLNSNSNASSQVVFNSQNTNTSANSGSNVEYVYNVNGMTKSTSLKQIGQAQPQQLQPHSKPNQTPSLLSQQLINPSPSNGTNHNQAWVIRIYQFKYAQC